MNFNALFNNPFFSIDISLRNGKFINGIFENSDIDTQFNDFGIIGSECVLTIKHDDYIKGYIALNDIITCNEQEYIIREIRNLRDSTVTLKLEEK